VELMPELRGDDSAIPSTANRLPDELLGVVISIALRRIDEVDSTILGCAEDAIRIGLRERLFPLRTKLEGPTPTTLTRGFVFPNRRYFTL